MVRDKVTTRQRPLLRPQLLKRLRREPKTEESNRGPSVFARPADRLTVGSLRCLSLTTELCHPADCADCDQWHVVLRQLGPVGTTQNVQRHDSVTLFLSLCRLCKLRSLLWLLQHGCLYLADSRVRTIFSFPGHASAKSITP